MNDIPVLRVEGRTLPEAWEKAVITAWKKGLSIKTEYDKDSDAPSRDCTMVMVVAEPMAEPRIHRSFPGGLEDLEIYRQEVVLGIHDHWINPDEGKWTYTYHQRLFNYAFDQKAVDQINYIIEKLSEKTYSRRAQAITWNPLNDPQSYDPPCLQRIWCRVTEAEDSSCRLNMNTHWRSRDAYKASFMNIFALTDLQRVIAEKISKKISRKISVGRYVDITDSFHIYGSDAPEFKKFLKVIRERSFEERTWSSEFAAPFFEEAQKRIATETQ